MSKSEDRAGTLRVRAVERTIELLTHLSQVGAEGASLADLARASGLTEATTLRYLLTLVEVGMVERDSDRRYRLGLGVLLLAEQALGNVDPRQIAIPIMEELRDAYDETINFAVFRHDRITLIEVLESTRSVKIGAHIGQQDPLHSTGLGKAILAHLPREERRRLLESQGTPRYTDHTKTTLDDLERDLQATQARGYAIDQEETHIGLSCVAVPVFDHQGFPHYALSLSAPSARLRGDRVHSIGRALLDASERISRRLGYTGPIYRERLA